MWENNCYVTELFLSITGTREIEKREAFRQVEMIETFGELTSGPIAMGTLVCYPRKSSLFT